MAKHKIVSPRSQKAGLPPGSLVYIGDKPVQRVRITVLDYDEQKLEEREVKTVEECFRYKQTPTVSWINVVGLHPKVIQTLGEHYGIHPLIQEDILNTDQRPKLEEFESYLYIVFKRLAVNGSAGQIASEQISLIVGDTFLLSFQESLGTVFNSVRERLRGGAGRMRKMDTDYLAYSLLDATVDHYFTAMEEVGEEIGILEEQLLKHPTPKTSSAIHRLKREMIFLRKAIWPLREVIGGLIRSESRLVKAQTRTYLRDVYDHIVQLIDTVETFRDLLSGMLDVYLSAMSNRLNEVIKVLTIITTIFIPLTFIAGIYGMNFEYMPELGHPFGYPGVLIVMAAVGLGMVAFFKKKKWM